MRFKSLIAILFLLFVSTEVTVAQNSNPIVDEYPAVQRLTDSSIRYVDEVNELVGQLIQDGTHRGYPGMFLAEDWKRFLWFKGFEISTLASLFPYLSDHNRTTLKAFLKYEVQNYLLNKPYRDYELQYDEAAEIKFPGGGPLHWWQWRSIEYETLYGLWAYAQYTDDWALIRDNWAAIRDIKNNISGLSFSKKIIAGAGTGLYEQAINSIISGKIAYGRMAKKLYSMTQNATLNQEYQQILAELPANLTDVESIIGCGYLQCQVGWDEIVPSCLANIAQLDFMTPSLGRWYAQNHLSQIQATIDDAEMRDPWWFMGSYNIMPGAHTFGNDGAGDYGAGCGEGYFESPMYAYQIFQGKARVLNASASLLIAQFPVATTTKTTPMYWDMFNYANLTALIESIEGVTWVNSNIAPPSLLVTLNSPEDDLTTENTSPTFSWSAVTDAATYEFQLDTHDPPTIVIVSQPTRSFTPPAPLLFTTYYWRVRALDGSGNPGRWSSTRSVHIVPKPGAAPSRTYYTNAAVTLTWNSVSWAEEYEIQVDDTSNFQLPLRYGQTVPKETLQVTTSPLSDSIYYWRVRALDAGGHPSAWSTIQTFVVIAS